MEEEVQQLGGLVVMEEQLTEMITELQNPNGRFDGIKKNGLLICILLREWIIIN